MRTQRREHSHALVASSTKLQTCSRCYWFVVTSAGFTVNTQIILVEGAGWGFAARGDEISEIRIIRRGFKLKEIPARDVLIHALSVGDFRFSNRLIERIIVYSCDYRSTKRTGVGLFTPRQNAVIAKHMLAVQSCSVGNDFCANRTCRVHACTVWILRTNFTALYSSRRHFVYLA